MGSHHSCLSLSGLGKHRNKLPSREYFTSDIKINQPPHSFWESPHKPLHSPLVLQRAIWCPPVKRPRHEHIHGSRVDQQEPSRLKEKNRDVAATTSIAMSEPFQSTGATTWGRCLLGW